MQKFHLISRKSGMIVGSYDTIEAALRHHDDFEIVGNDELDERLTRWADREGIDLAQLLTDDDGDAYALVESEDGYDRVYVDYTL